MSEIIEIQQAEILQAIDRAQIDMQIATAKQHLRDIKQAVTTIATLAQLDPETANECFYVLRRNGGAGSSTIEGVSVRMAEIIAFAWGNLRIQTQIIGNDGKTITARGICHDLETNVAVSVEVKRRITDKNGRTFSEDMQVVTGNAASAIAFRNAVLKVIPRAIIKNVIEETKRVALGQSIDMETSRTNIIAYFAKIGVTEEMLLEYLDIDHRDKIDKEMVFTLRGLANAIKEGTTSVQESFIKPVEERKQAEKARAQAAEAQARAAQAAQRQAAAHVDTNTGEVKE